MSESINYSEVLEVNTGKKNQAEYIYLFFFPFSPLLSKTYTAGVSPFD